jgi:hypothetical protein
MAIAVNNSTQTGSLSAGWTSDEYKIGTMVSGSLEFKAAAGVAGNFYLEVSNSGTDWFTVDGSTMAADDDGLFWNIGSVNSRFLRIGYSGVSTQAFSIYSVFKIHGAYRMEQIP